MTVSMRALRDDVGLGRGI